VAAACARARAVPFAFWRRPAGASTRHHTRLPRPLRSAGAGGLSGEALALLKSQDAAYIRSVIDVERARVERLQATLHGIASAGGDGAAPGNRHLLFSDGDGQGDVQDDGADAAPLIDDCVRGAAAGAGGAGKRSRRAADAAPPPPPPPPPPPTAATAAGTAAPSQRHLARASAAAYRELEERRARLATLERVLAAALVEKSLQGRGARTLVAPATRDAPPVYKWKPQRKR
jgi:hypothetical protein